MDHYTSQMLATTHGIVFMLTKARNLVPADMDEAFKPLDITSQQMGVMLWLNRGLGTTALDMSRHLGIDSGLMSRMLHKLEAKGLLKRTRRITDRRVVDLTLTSKGKQVAAAIPDIALPVLNGRLQGFSDEEFKELLRLLGKFIDADVHH